MDTNLDLFLVGPSLEGREQLSRKQIRQAKRLLSRKRLSANLVVDIGGTCATQPSIVSSPVASGACVCVNSGAVVGQSVDLINADTFCNVVIQGQSASGQLRVQLQTSDTDVSGNYTDPTSGLARFPRDVASGGIVWINSGGTLGGLLGGSIQTGANSGAPLSGLAEASGFVVAVAFQRPQNGRYARAIALSETTVQFGGSLQVGFVSQNKTTGSGGGFTLSPGSGAVSV